MGKPRYPTQEEFWKRLEVRGLEPDLVTELKARTDRESRTVSRAGEESLVVAVAARILPGAVPPKALAVFLDETFDTQLGRSEEKQGMMTRQQLVPAGFQILDEEARKRHRLRFADLPPSDQDDLLGAMEKGEVKGPKGFDSATWFRRVRESFITGFGSDPRGMVQMGYPGPPYKPGHLWLDQGEVRSRVERKRGYLKL